MVALAKHTTFRFPDDTTRKLAALVEMNEKARPNKVWGPPITRTAVLIALIEAEFEKMCAAERRAIEKREAAGIAKKSKAKPTKKAVTK